MNQAMPTEIKDKWARVCSAYQSMKEHTLKLLEHPESTEEQMMQAAVALRDSRVRLESARAKLSELYPRYTISTKGIAVKVYRTQPATTAPSTTTPTPTTI